MNAEEFFAVIFHPWVMMWCGQGLHFLKELRDIEVAGQHPKPWKIIRSKPFSAAFRVLAGFVAYGFLYASDQLTVAGAFTAGYMADSVVTAFSSRELKKIEGGAYDEREKKDA